MNDQDKSSDRRENSLTYKDKSSDRTVVLKPSSMTFLVLTKPDEGEALKAILSQKVFSITPSTNKDGVFILRAKSEAESAVEIDKAIAELARQSEVKAVVPAVEDEEGNVRYVLPERVVVQFKNISDGKVVDLLGGLGSAVVKAYRSSGLYEVSKPADITTGDFITMLNNDQHVVFAEPCFYAVDDNDIRVGFLTPGTSGEHAEISETGGYGWNLEKLMVNEAWQYTRGRDDVVVAVIDGMPDTTHPAIKDKFIGPIDDSLIFSADLSTSSHATNVCSVIAAESAEALGVAPGVRLTALVVNLQSQVYAERADALRKAAQLASAREINGVGFSRLVLSCSWRTSGDIAVIRTALEEAAAANVLLVFSAGNDNSDAPHYPSDYSRRPGCLEESLIAVAATDKADQKSSYSNYSASIDVCAPGGDGLPLDARDVLCADQNGSFVFAAGTSIAAPHVAALAALLLSLNPQLVPKDLKQLIKDNTDDISAANAGFVGRLGNGRINAYKAVATTGTGSGPSDLVKTQLKECSDAIEAATGWTVASALVVKDNSEFEISLRQQ
jgi:subtilisin family serine protease